MADRSLVERAVAAALEKRKETETGDRAPDELGTATGWRAWQVARMPDENGHVLLGSVTHNYKWVPFQKARASCDRGCASRDPRDPDCTPGNTCTCGFYSARTLNHLREMGYHAYNDEYDGAVTIVGRVANWGKVVPGTQGWRAEYAYPEMLFIPFEVARAIARPVAETYGVPVQLMNLLDPSAKPNKRHRSHTRVLPPLRQEPRFLQEYRDAHHNDDVDDV